MKAILCLLLLAAPALGTEAEARARAAYAYAAAMTEEPEQANVIEFKNLDALAQPAQPAGEWRTVQVCNNDGTGCHLEQRWFPAEQVTVASTAKQMDPLDELNAQRAARGLRPYIRDANLTAAAQACADVRAKALCFGHTQNDFAALPAGTQSSASGCAAWYPGEGFGACGVYDNYTYAGAAFTMGADGKRYMHAFYR